MSKLLVALVCIFISAISHSQVSDPQKIIKLKKDGYIMSQLNLDLTKNYGFLAKDVQEMFPHLVKEKRINQRFGKNAYRTKVIKVINEKELPATVLHFIKNNLVPVDTMREKIFLIEKEILPLNSTGAL